MSTPSTPQPSAPLSRSYRVGDLVFISGLVPLERDVLMGTTVEQQTEYVLTAMSRELESNGATMADVVKTTVLLANASRDWRAMNSVYVSHFPDPKPARSAFGVELADERILVEIEAVAVCRAG